MRLRPALAAAACVALFVAGFAGARRNFLADFGRAEDESAINSSTASAAGGRISDVVLEDHRGQRLRLSGLTEGRPTLVLVVSAEDCLSCANFPVEMRVVRNKFPGLKRIMLGTGKDTAFFREYGREKRISSEMVLDPGGEFLKSVGAAGRTPAVLLLDAERNVLLFEHRSGPAFSGFPVTEQLLAVLRVLNAAGAPRVAPGGERAARTSVPMPEPGAPTISTRGTAP